MELVRNAVFNTIGESVLGTRVLDLFAGSGGLGIEALSRGAASCIFVENHRGACSDITRNLEKTRLAGGKVVCADALQWIDRNAMPDGFELILADPPYAMRGENFSPALLGSEKLRAALTPGGIFILEHEPDAELPIGEAWDTLRSKRYGSTAVTFLRPRPQTS
jgi:16S rRNA (guanine966-N2)-methyltransferase